MSSPRKLTQEDRETLTKGESLYNLVQSDGWDVAKTMLDEQLKVLSLVSTIDLKRPAEEIGMETYGRAQAINLVQGWFNSIQGAIDLYHEQVNAINDEEDDIIKEY